MNFAAKVLELNQQWETIDKISLAENIERHLEQIYPNCNTYTARLEKLIEITGSKKESAYAWINRGRTNVKAPMLKVCAIAAALDIDVFDLLKPTEKK